METRKLKQWEKASFDAKDSRISGNPKRHVWNKKALTLSSDAKSCCFDQVFSVKKLERKEKVSKKVEISFTRKKKYIIGINKWTKLNLIIVESNLIINIKIC